MKTEKASRDELLLRAQQEDATPDEQLSPEALTRKRDRKKKRKQRAVEQKEKAARFTRPNKVGGTETAPYLSRKNWKR